MFCGSADWMARNLYERCEVVFPVENSGLAERLGGILDAYLKDDTKARELGADGEYVRAKKSGAGFNAQEWLMNLNAEKA